MPNLPVKRMGANERGECALRGRLVHNGEWQFFRFFNIHDTGFSVHAFQDFVRLGNLFFGQREDGAKIGIIASLNIKASNGQNPAVISWYR